MNGILNNYDVKRFVFLIYLCTASTMVLLSSCVYYSHIVKVCSLKDVGGEFLEITVGVRLCNDYNGRSRGQHFQLLYNRNKGHGQKHD